MNELGVTIQVNGEPRRISGTATVSDLLRELNIKPDRVAVELNLEIVERGAFDTRSLKEGDRIEILSFIGGGKA
jgi:thiamine biosynthesis protein ThiS